MKGLRQIFPSRRKKGKLHWKISLPWIDYKTCPWTSEICWGPLGWRPNMLSSWSLWWCWSSLRRKTRSSQSKTLENNLCGEQKLPVTRMQMNEKEACWAPNRDISWTINISTLSWYFIMLEGQRKENLLLWSKNTFIYIFYTRKV